MEAAPPPKKEVWWRRKGTLLWTAVVVVAVILAAVIAVRVLSGATTPAHPFSFSFTPPSCGCVKFTQTTHPFPTTATIHFNWWTQWTGNNGSVELAIAQSNGTLVYLAVSEYQQGNPFNDTVPWGQGGAGTFSGHGSPFTFAVNMVTLDYFLPADTTIWVNGTYTTPLL
jgi:FlaG/FlaF family flagellin (archaellin)